MMIVRMRNTRRVMNLIVNMKRPVTTMKKMPTPTTAQLDNLGSGYVCLSLPSLSIASLLELNSFSNGF